MHRREWITTAGVLATGVGVAAAQRPPAAQSGPAHDHHAAADTALLEAAAECVKRGKLCRAHCLELLSNKDVSIAGCAHAVADMLAVSAALEDLAAAGSRHARAVARAMIGVLKDCEAECNKHKDQHAACRDCSESCARLRIEAGRAAA